MAEGHSICLGMSGSGKSRLILRQVIKSLEKGDEGLLYGDPKGDGYSVLLSYLMTSGRDLWEARKHKIILVNPVAKCDRLVAFNAIQLMDNFRNMKPDPVGLMANTIVSLIRGQDAVGVFDYTRMQNIMDPAIATLAIDHLSLAELPLLFEPSKTKSPYNRLVESILPRIEHFGTRSFWESQYPTWNASDRRAWVQSSEGRIFRYLFDERMLMTCCTIDNATLDFQQVVNDGYWVFVNMPFALLSDSITTLLGNLLITKILYACMQRGTGGRGFRIILDEARFFNSGPLDVILETARAYNLWLTLVVQSLDQLCRKANGVIDQHLMETALNNTRYLSVFRNESDVERLAQMLFPITGMEVAQEYLDGRREYLPIAAEVDRNQRRLSTLGFRQVVLYDKLANRPVRVHYTPDMEVEMPDPAAIDLFEGAHMQVMGRPAIEIKREIVFRNRRLRALLENRPAAVGVAPPDMGGQL